MATIKLNGVNRSDASNFVCFNSNPNIVAVEDTGTQTYEKATIKVSNLAPQDPSLESIIKFNGYAINGVDESIKVHGRNFYRKASGKIEYCAISIVNALKSIPQLAMNYNIIFQTYDTIMVQAKNKGKRYHIDITTENLNNLKVTYTRGSDSQSLAGMHNSRIYLDIYKNDGVGQGKINQTSSTSYDYVTTLQKEFYQDSMSFNITPVLNSFSSYDDTASFQLKLYAITDEQYQDLGIIDDNYIINGYSANQGDNFLDFGADESINQHNVYPALNVQRGDKTRTQFNKSTMYIYKPEFQISLYKIGNNSTENVKIKYLEADETLVDNYSGDTQAINLRTDSNIFTYTIPLDEAKMRDSYFIDLEFSFGIIRLNVINPPYSQAQCNRVYWNNSYGGISFFDFTGDKKDTRTTTVETYNKTLLNFYENNIQEQEVIYFRDNKLDVKLTTHLIDENGLYQLYDLQNSYRAWITINGVQYYIIIKAIDVQEPSDSVYTVTIKYNYSLLDSFK